MTTQNHNDNFTLRLHRAKSWLNCAKQYSDDDDMAYIALWISFNSCYSEEIDDAGQCNERRNFNHFISQLVRYDHDNKIENCLWDNYSNFIRTLISNQYVCSYFWKALREGKNDWQEPFERSKQKALHDLAERKAGPVMNIVLDRLYCLRNQLMHGGATYQGSVNRQQVKDGKRMLAELVPIIIEIMENSGEPAIWGEVAYPVV